MSGSIPWRVTFGSFVPSRDERDAHAYPRIPIAVAFLALLIA